MEMILITESKLTELLTTIVKNELSFLIETNEPKEDLMTKDEILKLFKVNPATIWRWQNLKKITAYKIGNKCFYKRSEIMGVIDKSKL